GDVGQFGDRALRLLQARNARGDILVVAALEQPLAHRHGDVGRVERALDREQPVAALVLLADAHRLVGAAVKLLAYLHFDERTLLLDHDDEIEAVGEFFQLALRQRPRTADLVDADAELVALDLVEIELVERPAHVEIALAGGNDADLGVAAARS